MRDTLGPERNGVDITIGRSGLVMAAAMAAEMLSGLYSGARAATDVVNLHNAPACSAPSSVALHTITSDGRVYGDRLTNAGKAYETTTAGTLTSCPTGTGATINVGGGTMKYLSDVSFTSWSAWAASLPATLTSAQDVRLWNDLPGTMWGACLSVGVRSSSTNNLTIHPAAGESFSDNPNRGTHKLQASPNYGVMVTCAVGYTPAIHIDTDYVLIAGMQTRTYSAGQAGQGINVNGHIASGTAINNFLMDNSHHDSGPLAFAPGYGQGICITVANNVLMQAGTINPPNGRSLFGNRVGDCSRIESNTMVLPTNYDQQAWGFDFFGSYNATAITIRNNAMVNFGNPLRYPPCTASACYFNGAADGHNVTDVASFDPAGGGPHGANGSAITISNVFNAATASMFREGSWTAAGGIDLRPGTASALLHAGAAPSSLYLTTDIFGTTRPVGGDVGAFEVSTAVGSALGVRVMRFGP